MKDPVLIIGGGLAGLSAAIHLKKTPHILIEKESVVGGTARSFFIKGFTFDVTGHLLHLHTPYTKKFITHLLNGKFFTCKRNTWIHLENAQARYPFQANTNGLPERVVDDCVLGFLKTKLSINKKNPNRNFKDWCYQAFGEGISEYFMIPYNQKLFQTRASQMTTDWCGSFVPNVQLEEVIKGALTPQKKRFGYNATFLYPRRGGIQSLAEAMAKNMKNIYLGHGLKTLDWKNKVATLFDGTQVRYSHLINTIPLSVLLNQMVLPKDILRSKKKLKMAGILCANIGVKRSNISDKSWIYFPEKKYPFYRVGFPMNFTPHVVPKGCSSMYVEIPMTRVKGLSTSKIQSLILKGLRDAGILQKSDKIVVLQLLPVPFAYVRYDKNRTSALKKIFSFLKKNKIQSIGRYGGWKYSFMEAAILDGKNAAEKIRHV